MSNGDTGPRRGGWCSTCTGHLTLSLPCHQPMRGWTRAEWRRQPPIRHLSLDRRLTEGVVG
jgi:hypothetical protein